MLWLPTSCYRGSRLLAWALGIACALAAWPAPAQQNYPSTPAPSPDWLVNQPADGEIEFENSTPTGGAPAATEEEDVWEQMNSPMVGSGPDGCPAFWYSQAEGLFMQRNTPDRTQIAASLALRDFDYEPGVRATVGRQADCLDAWEVTYTGMREWSQTQSVAGVGLQSLFGPATATFDGATAQSVIYESEFHSLELTHRQWGWDILSTTVGLRYVRLDEEFSFTSTSGLGDGFYNVDIDNNLFGVQVGGDTYYPLSRRLSVGLRGKFGLYWNHLESSTAFNDGPNGGFANNLDKDDVALSVELGLLATYRVSPRLTVKAGYEIWYFWNVGLAPEQINYNLRQDAIMENGNLFVTGATAGFEYQW